MIYEVIVDIASGEVDKVYDYSSDFPIQIGSRVVVPFGPRTIEGFVLAEKEDSSRATKSIIKLLDEQPVITEELVSLAVSLRREKNLRYIDTLRLCIPPKLRGGRVREMKKGYITLNENYDGELPTRAKKQLLLMERLKDGGDYETDINNEFGASVLKGLLDKGIAKKEMITQFRTPYRGLRKDVKSVVLTREQQTAVTTIMMQKGSFLLHGVTGSGKTEIYMRVIEEMLAMGKTAIMLVPEISLTPQMLGLFRARFGDRVSLLHSGLSDGERYDEWRRLLNGDALVALGARSAIFAPLRNIGVIILDEEHDGSYVSESNPRYFTHEIAEYRAKANDAKLVFGSATPSLESYKKALDGEYTLITLNGRVNERELPDMEIVDMRKELRVGNFSVFSRKLENALEEVINDGNQAMLFVNRRGFASFVRCRDCGYVPKCEDCEVSLTYHKEDSRLKCHYCGREYKALTVCPECGSTHIKDGKIGTERVVAEIIRLFPNVKVLRMDYDTTTSKNAFVEILSAFSRGEAQVLVGTQMIAKGHDFPDVTLVGILDADLSLYFSDYRSNEHTYQLITQVAGRAGRKDKAGKVIMQTYNPNHYVFRFAQEYDYKGFFDKECNIREATQFPPYSKIARILVLGEDEIRTYKAAKAGFEKLKLLKANATDIFKVQAMRAPIRRIMKNYRFQIVAWVKQPCDITVMNGLYELAEGIKERGVSCFLEINPTQMM